MTQAAANIKNTFVRLAGKTKYMCKSLGKRFMAMPLKKRVAFVIAAVLTLALCITIPVLAWFSSLRKAAELHEIGDPNALYIYAAHDEDQMYFDIGNINLESNATTTTTGTTTTTSGYALYVFTVSGTDVKKYTLQLAHTTNNDFTYTIYKATESENIPTAEDGSTLINGKDYVTYTTAADSTPLYYELKESNNITQDDAYKNQSGTNALKTDSYYYANYDTNDEVSQDAAALYWQKSGITPGITSGNFSDAYILKISWTDADSIMNKETDVVCLSVAGED